MAKPTAQIDYNQCDWSQCKEKGVCPCVAACKHKVLKQEAPDEPPYQLGLCQGCALCVTACPRKAIRLL